MSDLDPFETADWRAALRGVRDADGPARVRFLLDALHAEAQALNLDWRPSRVTPARNTVPVESQAPFPGDLDLELKLGALIRWNALAMVVRANAAHSELGGHVASYASAADLFEVGFNHFFRAPNAAHPGDLVYLQPHSAPGVYARAFLEGRLSDADLAHYRRELAGPAAGARGLSSYPHPMLMPDFWQFPTGSMGIGPLSSIYQARFLRYLEHRGLAAPSNRRVWGIFGDGEMDEPESMSGLTLAAREGLDNLTWVINCNLQRLDGPVRGNGRIIDELEQLFAGAGWHVVKLLWGSDWDGLFARDQDGALERALAVTVDGQMQTFAAKDGRYNREHFFDQNESLKRLVQGMSDAEIDRLRRGGHDLVKIHAAYAHALTLKGAPTVILAHTKKGYGLSGGQGRMTTHSHKKFDAQDLRDFRDRFSLPINDAAVADLSFFKPAADSAELAYLHARRAALGGPLPARSSAAERVAVPPLGDYAGFALNGDARETSTTMAFVRLLGALLKDPILGPRLVPIVADEARTFGMANLFKQVGIYSSVGQRYAPEDIGSVLSYREARDGQILEEGISEAGALASFTAAATAYSAHGLAMVPFYIYYSMFGFQRVGDQIWAAADQRPRGFLIGATSGRTTLAGEGLQHQDGSSHLVASTIPNLKAYDPAFAGELAVLIDHGLRAMLIEQVDVFFYLTTMNASYPQRALAPDQHAAVIKGGYVIERHAGARGTVTLLGSGAILLEVLAAAEQLAAREIAVDVLSITSFSELARDAILHGDSSHLHSLLASTRGPLIAVTDYVRLVPEQIRAHLPPSRPLHTLGTDGFGLSDTRAALRAHFGVDAAAIAARALLALNL